MKPGVPYGKYILLGRLSKGGMAEIFLARSADSANTHGLLALKRTLPEYGGDREFLSMFLDEAYISTSLEHPNICRVSDTGQNGKELYMVMEFVHGKDLRMICKKLAKQGREMPPVFVAYILAKIARALHYAHTKCDPIDGKAQNIVHRDVNPQNILISYSGTPKLIDFGIAKARDRVSKTRAGVLKGKFSYLSPEQVLGHAVDGRSDIFALGVVLYSLLVGSRPFEARGEPALLLKISQGKYTPARELKPDLDPSLDAIIDKALKVEVAERYESAALFADELEKYLQKYPPITDDDLGLFVKEVFGENYERELAQIKEYEAGNASVLENSSSGSKKAETKATVETQVEGQASSRIVDMATVLAAGYDEDKSLSADKGVDFDPDATQMLLAKSDGELPKPTPMGESVTEVSQTGPERMAALASAYERRKDPQWNIDETAFVPGAHLGSVNPAMEGSDVHGLGEVSDEELTSSRSLYRPASGVWKEGSQPSKNPLLSGFEIGILIVAALVGAGVVYWLYTAKVNAEYHQVGSETQIIELKKPGAPN